MERKGCGCLGNRGQQADRVRSVTLRCQTNLVLSVRSDILPGGEMERQRSVAVGKWPCSRLMPIVLAGRSLAAYCGVLPVRSIAGYCWVMSGEASRHPAGVSWVRPILRPVSAVCGRRNEARALRCCLRIAAVEWSGLQSWRVRPGRGRNSADHLPRAFPGKCRLCEAKGKILKAENLENHLPALAGASLRVLISVADIRLTIFSCLTLAP
jgi:hypothetical protein